MKIFMAKRIISIGLSLLLLNQIIWVKWCFALGDDGKNLVHDNIIEVEEDNGSTIDRKYRDSFIKIGKKDKSFIEVVESESMPIRAHEGYIFVGYKVDDIYFIKSREEFIYKPSRFILAIQNDQLKLFYTGLDGKIRDITSYVEEKFQRYNIHFQGFEKKNIYIIAIRGINKFELKSLKEVNNVLTYIKLKN